MVGQLLDSVPSPLTFVAEINRSSLPVALGLANILTSGLSEQNTWKAALEMIGNYAPYYLT